MIRRLLAVFIVLMPVTAWADDFTIELTPGWDNEMQLVTDYIDRGISQTKGRPSAQLSSSYTLDNGVFASVEATHSTIGGQGVELDLEAGIKKSWNERLKWQADVIYQNYPWTQDHAQNDVEFQGIINYDVTDWATFIAAATFQPQAQEHAGFQTYSSAGFDFKLPEKFHLQTRVGYLTTQMHREQPNYVDWTVAVSHKLTDDITLIGQYTGLTEHCSDCGNRFVAMLQIDF